MYIEIIAVGALGLIVGSYLNVYILRLHTGKSTTGRSGCMSCAIQLRWYELLPVVSYVALRGRCRSCGSAFSMQYWMVEALTAVLFMLVWIQYASIWTTAILLALMSVLVVILVYDIRHTIIPNETVYAAALLACALHIPALAVVQVPQALVYIVSSVFAAVVVASPLFFLWAVSRGTWMGFGDVKLSLVFGIALGIYEGLMSLMVGFVIGACVGVMLMYAPKVIRALGLGNVHNTLTMKSEVPFAPFLITGFVLVVLGHVDIIALIEMALL